ncbi:MAG: glycosyltransferase, partial [Alphaproteobacteria bacterium]
MPQIIFFCPSVTVINGGIKHIFRMAEALIELGYNAVVFEQNGQRPAWFQSTAPIIGQGVINPNADQLYVLPEDQPHILSDVKKFPQKKVIYSQNHFYGAIGIADAASYGDYGVTDILCSSKTIYDHCRLRHPALKAYVIPCAVDEALFKPAPTKRNAIAFMPRKRPVEAIYIRDMFRFACPQYLDWEWDELSNLSESEIARAMGEAKVFLSLSRLEGFGLTPLEAMAAG